ncbi:MAG: hypothetical protein ACOZCP_05325, partial [Pseudomonadota bacterium]
MRRAAIPMGSSSRSSITRPRRPGGQPDHDDRHGGDDVEDAVHGAGDRSGPALAELTELGQLIVGGEALGADLQAK